MQMSKKLLPVCWSWPLLVTVVFLPLAVAAPPGKDVVEKPPTNESTRQAPIKSQSQTPALQVPATQASSAQTPPQPTPPKRGPTDKQPGFMPTEKIGADAAVSFPVDI